MEDHITADEVRQILAAADREALSKEHDALCLADPPDWNYLEVIKRYSHNATVLDMGCGYGEFLKALLPFCKRAIGVDSSVASIEKAITLQCSGRRLPNLLFCQGDARDLFQLESGAFDLILSRHGPFYIEEVDRLLRPGGYLVVQTLGNNNLQELYAALEFPKDKKRSLSSVKEVIQGVKEKSWKIYENNNSQERVPYSIESLLFIMAAALLKRIDLSALAAATNYLLKSGNTRELFTITFSRDLIVAQKPP